MCQHVLTPPSLATLSVPQPVPAETKILFRLKFTTAFGDTWFEEKKKKMALPIWLCGAIPFDPVMAYDPAAGESVNRVLMCCHCHVMESMALLERIEEQHTSDPDHNLPDVVPKIFPLNEEPDSSVKEIYPPPTDDKSAANWKQVGQDLRRIADQFESMRQPGRKDQQSSAATAGSWIQTCLVHGLIAYVGWRIQKWASGWSGIQLTSNTTQLEMSFNFSNLFFTNKFYVILYTCRHRRLRVHKFWLLL